MLTSIALINIQDLPIRSSSTNELPATLEVSLIGAATNLGSKVRAEFPKNSDATLRIFDLVGATVRSQSLISTSNPGFVEVDISGMMELGLGRAEVQVLAPILPLPDEIPSDPQPVAGRDEGHADAEMSTATPTQPDFPPIPPPAAFDPLA